MKWICLGVAIATCVLTTDRLMAVVFAAAALIIYAIPEKPTR